MCLSVLTPIYYVSESVLHYGVTLLHPASLESDPSEGT